MNFLSRSMYRLAARLAGPMPLLRRFRRLPSAQLGRPVNFDIYLPPGYARLPGVRFPLILFNDGQDLATMRFGEILEGLYRREAIPGMIVAAIYAGPERRREYGTARQADYLARGDKAGAYRDFLMGEMLPFLEQRFRLSGRPEDTALAGFSLGGLSALDIAWAYPERFGAAGVFSGALWWRSAPVDPRDPDADRIMHEIVRAAPGPPSGQRFWFQCGTRDEMEDRNNNGVIDSIDDTLHLIEALQEKGYAEAAIRYLEIEGGEHTPATWAVAMPDFLQWVLNPGER